MNQEAEFSVFDIVRQVPKALFENMTQFRKEIKYVAVIRGVNPAVHPINDFHFNGTLESSGTYTNMVSGGLKDVDLSKIDFTRENIKVIFSKEKITDTGIISLFKAQLTIRVQGLQDGVLEYITLRNAYGGSQQHHYLDINNS